MKALRLVLALGVSFFGAYSAVAGPVDCATKEIKCPANTGNVEHDSEEVAKLIDQQKCCWGAANVFNECAVGNVYNLEDQMAPMMKICNNIISKDKKVNAQYTKAVKNCERSGQSRQDVAVMNQCVRKAADFFSYVVETVKAQD